MAKNLSNGLRQCAIVGSISLALFSCERFAGARRRALVRSYADTDSMGVSVRNIATVPLHAPRELSENSAAAMSRRHSGIFFTINDSGNEPLLFALDTAGASRGVWRVSSATNVDWESAAVGPCSRQADPEGDCVYIGDTGDNDAAHPSRAIYRLREPDPITGRGTVSARVLQYVYADGPHDVEAMYVAPDGDIILVTKRPLAGRSGVLRPALIFVLPESLWTAHGRVVASLIDSLPIVPGSAPLRYISDASLSADGRHLAVRTYAQVYVFATDPRSGRIDHGVRPTVCNVAPLNEAGGEGITWVDDAGRLAFTSEGREAPLHLANCPVP